VLANKKSARCDPTIPVKPVIRAVVTEPHSHSRPNQKTKNNFAS